MNVSPAPNRIAVAEGDITRQPVDAIVNAANTTLLNKSSVDKTIHRAAEPKLLKEYRALNSYATNQAKITKNYRLPTQFMIHTVGPIWRNGSHKKDKLL